MFSFSSFFFTRTICAWYLPILDIYALSRSAANTSETHHRFSTSILPFDLIFFVRSFLIAILCCCFISTSSVDSSCLLFQRCKLYSLNNEKIIFCSSCVLSPYKGVTSACKCPFLDLFDFVLVQDFLLHSLSQLLPAQVHLALAQTSPFFHLFRVFLHSGIGPFLHLFNRPSWYFLLFFGFSPFYLVTFVHLPAKVLFAWHPI